MARRKKYTKRTLSKYKTYRKKYFDKKRRFQKQNRRRVKHGKEPSFNMRENVMTRSDFASIYDSYKRVLVEEGAQNPTSTQIIDRIVADQAYEKSRAQYIGLMKQKERILEETGYQLPTMTESEFRAGVVNIDWDQISNDYYYFKDGLGLSSEQARREISMLYFGSK